MAMYIDDRMGVSVILLFSTSTAMTRCFKKDCFEVHHLVKIQFNRIYVFQNKRHAIILSNRTTSCFITSPNNKTVCAFTPYCCNHEASNRIQFVFHTTAVLLAFVFQLHNRCVWNT